MQKTRSILFLRQVLDHLEQEDSTDIGRNITFREKDLTILHEECQTKYNIFADLQTQKANQDFRILELKEQLCQLNPEALEEIERDCEKAVQSEEEVPPVKEKVTQNHRPIKKKNDRKKKRKDRFLYD